MRNERLSDSAELPPDVDAGGEEVSAHQIAASPATGEPSPLVYAAYGGGDNSTAMLVEAVNRGEQIDFIGAADTGGERPIWYSYVPMFSEWLVKQGYPAITVVRVESTTLEADCLKRKALPSIAYGGFKTCSQRFKLEPQDKLLRNIPAVKEHWAKGGKVVKWIGYDVDEEHRAKSYSDERYQVRYPLIEWEMDREDCHRVIKAAGLPIPGKSSCFFCPNMDPEEIVQLGREHPDLLQRALTLEQNAELSNIKGLGRSWPWADVVKADRAQIKLFPVSPKMPCGGDCGL
jgi:hypothetical protein